MSQNKYDAERLEQLSDIEHVRRRPKMYFAVDGIGSIEEFIARLAEDPKALGAETVNTETWNGWWIVSSSNDWLPDNGKERSAVFESFSPFRRDDCNSFHYTVFVTALAQKAVTMTDETQHVICGNVLDDDPIWAYSKKANLKRSLAFVMDDSIFE